MDRSQKRIAAVLFALALASPTVALAQDELGGGTDIEGGATEASDVEMGMGGSSSYSSSGGGSASYSSSGGGGGGGGGGGDFDGGGGGDGLRLALQFRLDAINLVGLADPTGADIGRAMVPLVTPGVRLSGGKLFLGLGLGFAGTSSDTMGATSSRSGFSLSPMGSYDIIDGSAGALALIGWFNYASLGETELCSAGGMCMNQTDDSTGIGLNLGVQVRGKLNESVAFGTEWGWGFLSVDVGGATDVFVHGIFGSLLLETSVGL